jgi:hypothetical protein
MMNFTKAPEGNEGRAERALLNGPGLIKERKLKIEDLGELFGLIGVTKLVLRPIRVDQRLVSGLVGEK